MTESERDMAPEGSRMTCVERDYWLSYYLVLACLRERARAKKPISVEEMVRLAESGLRMALGQDAS
ncbi:MAG: hypothetical protein KGL39_07810 [Patescibacteria group bacterium]|nr:hypothetical protein [Patescibacteria group bacterium]